MAGGGDVRTGTARPPENRRHAPNLGERMTILAAAVVAVAVTGKASTGVALVIVRALESTPTALLLALLVSPGEVLAALLSFLTQTLSAIRAARRVRVDTQRGTRHFALLQLRTCVVKSAEQRRQTSHERASEQPPCASADCQCFSCCFITAQPFTLHAPPAPPSLDPVAAVVPGLHSQWHAWTRRARARSRYCSNFTLATSKTSLHPRVWHWQQ